jgi:hypothetical protein
MPSSLLLLLLLAAPAGEPRVLDRVLAVVDGKPVLLSDVRVTEMLKGVTREQAVEANVDEKLMAQEAARVPQADPHQDELERAERALLQRWPESAGAAPMAALNDAARRQVRILKYVEFRFRAQARVEDAGLREAYDKEVQGTPGAPSFDAAKDLLRERLERAALDEQVEAWVKSLRAAAEIRYNPSGP